MKEVTITRPEEDGLLDLGDQEVHSLGLRNSQMSQSVKNIPQDLVNRLPGSPNKMLVSKLSRFSKNATMNSDSQLVPNDCKPNLRGSSKKKMIVNCTHSRYF